MKLTQQNKLFHKTALRTVASVFLTLVLVFGLVPLALPSDAYAVTSEEKQAEADALMEQLDELQNQINDVTQRLADATEAQESALHQMEDAKAREEAASARTTELQKQLGERAALAYRNGNVGYLEVIFGAKSFTDFLVSWDMINRLNSHDAQLVSESKAMRLEAEAARQIFAEQERIAAEKKTEVAALKAQLEQKSADMSAEIERINEEIAELIAQEEAAAEAARLAAAAAAAAESNGWLDPEVIMGLGGFVHPCPGAPISSRFGWRAFDNAFHKGLDLAAPTGASILAAQAGTVIISGWGSGAGNWAVIAHGNGVRTIYMHASELYVSAGEYVAAGQVIAAVGNTGYSFGSHLHFQIEINGAAVNPEAFIY